MKIAVLYGGFSAEREVSLRSGKSVYDASIEAGFNADLIDVTEINSALATSLKSYDIVLPIMHGMGGEDGQIQKLLEGIGVAYLGCDSSVSAQCFFKNQARKKMIDAAIPMPEGGLMNVEEYRHSMLSIVPHVIKPNDGGSSIDTLLVKDPKNNKFAEELFSKHNKMIVEELIDGIELTVPLIDGLNLVPIEIIPPSGGEFDYDNKYNGKTQELCPPKNISKDKQQEAIDLAKKVHSTMGCRHMSRTDMIMTPDGELIVLETNTIPGLTAQSLMPKAAVQAGLTMPELVSHFIKISSVVK